ncbi:MAG TPA: hypothetical protein PLE19_04560 [Planctomycetota bacterium]|nr:hypothetical protein [Planctomycetota bacterium]HRR79059.1 hypothetical protein [Planctomycetota bacterium]HRT93009.1 hypothetical protein [Planctomycetota bacterium]
MKLKKWLVRGAVGVVVLLVAVVVAIWLWGDAAARKGVEIGGTSALGVETTLKSASIGWLSGTVGIRGLKIANPQGYQTDRLMALGGGKVACDIGSLLSDEVVVREILIEEPELTIELKPGLPPKSNLGDLLASMKSDEPAPAKKEEPKADKGEGKRFRVDLIRVTKTKVRFHLLMGKTADLVLPDIELKEVRNSDGTLPRLVDIFRQVLVGMSTSAFQNAHGIVPDDLLKSFGDPLASAQKLIGGSVKFAGEAAGQAVKSASAAAEAATKSVTGAAEGATKAVGEVGKGVGGALEGILGKKKKKTP